MALVPLGDGASAPEVLPPFVSSLPQGSVFRYFWGHLLKNVFLDSDSTSHNAFVCAYNLMS